MHAMPPQVLQFAGSLIAILVLAIIARWLGLGTAAQLQDDAAVREACEQAVPGFHAIALSRDSEGRGAIARDSQGRIMVLRGHGAHLAGRLLTSGSQAGAEGGTLIINTGEKRYGAVRLAIADASAWVQAIDALKGAPHA